MATASPAARRATTFRCRHVRGCIYAPSHFGIYLTLPPLPHVPRRRCALLSARIIIGNSVANKRD